MKKIIFFPILIIFSVIPVIAACPLIGVCSAENPLVLPQPIIQNQNIQNNLNDTGQPLTLPTIQQNGLTNSMQPEFGLNNPEDNQIQPPSERPYNASCQFGTCLP